MAEVDYLRGADVCQVVADGVVPARKKATKRAPRRPTARSRQAPRASLFDLSFVAAIPQTPQTNRLCYWHVRPTDSYGLACQQGEQHAVELLQFLKDNPIFAGANTLGKFVSDMVAARESEATKGYEVGFWAAIEKVLLRAVAIDSHEDVLRRMSYHPVDTIAK